MTEEEKKAIIQEKEWLDLMEKVAELVKAQNIPFVAVFQASEYVMQVFSHLPENSISELLEIGYNAGVYKYGE